MVYSNRLKKESKKRSSNPYFALSQLPIPNGWPLFYWDSYNSMEEVLNHLMFSSIVTEKEKAEISGYIPNGWDNKVIFEILAFTSPSN